MTRKTIQKNIAIVGTGYVGLSIGAALASLGHQIINVDKNKDKIQKLKKGETPIFELGLTELLRKHQKNISFTTNLKNALRQSQIVFVTVDTPANKNGTINLRNFKQAIQAIAQNLKPQTVIIIKSTVPVGTSEWTKNQITQYFKKEFHVVANPEFLREGSALQDFLNPDRIILGIADQFSKKTMQELYALIKAPKIFTDFRSAELIKYAANAFLATKISFINEIANICEGAGADVKKVAYGIGLDKRIGHQFLNAGIGYGGSCFPKDIAGLIAIAKNHQYRFKLLEAVITVNKQQQQIFIKKTKQIMKKNRGKIIGVWGLSFKPDTDDIRKSPAIEIIKKLAQTHYQIQVYDPLALNNAKKLLPQKSIKFCSSALTAAKNADVLALLTQWPEFNQINLQQIKKLMHQSYFLDGRNQFEPAKMRQLGFNYQGIGRS